MNRCYTCLYNYECVSDKPRCNMSCDGDDPVTLSNYEFMKRMDDKEMAVFLSYQDFSEKDPLGILKWLHENAQYSEEDAKDYRFWFG